MRCRCGFLWGTRPGFAFYETASSLGPPGQNTCHQTTKEEEEEEEGEREEEKKKIQSVTNLIFKVIHSSRATRL